MDSQAWDERYAAVDLVWSAEPNRFLAAEAADLRAGRALDLACGEGRNAIWLAVHGWEAVGVDFSSVGVERARRLADEAGVGDRASFVVGDVVAGPLPAGPFDAVVVAYLQLAAPQRRTALSAAAATLAPGGTMLVVAHDRSNLSDGVGGPQDAAVLYTPEDVLADLAGVSGLAVEKAQRVVRPVQTPDGERNAIDALVRLRRATVG